MHHVVIAAIYRKTQSGRRFTGFARVPLVRVGEPIYYGGLRLSCVGLIGGATSVAGLFLEAPLP